MDTAQDIVLGKNTTKSSFSIDCLLGNKGRDQATTVQDPDSEHDDLDIDIEDDDDDDIEDIVEADAETVLVKMPTLVRPEPRLMSVPPTCHDSSAISSSSLMENRTNESSKDGSEEDAAIAAALQNSLFYSQHPSNFLYSQWLATRNTSALFGLQGSSFL